MIKGNVAFLQWFTQLFANATGFWQRKNKNLQLGVMQHLLTHWVPYMTVISVIKIIISVAVWRIYPSCVGDRLRALGGLRHSGMLWTRFTRDDFHSKLEILFFPELISFWRVVSPRFSKVGAECSSSGVFGFGDASELFFFWKLRFVTMIFLRTLNRTASIFWKFP